MEHSCRDWFNDVIGLVADNLRIEKSELTEGFGNKSEEFPSLIQKRTRAYVNRSTCIISPKLTPSQAEAIKRRLEIFRGK